MEKGIFTVGKTGKIVYLQKKKRKVTEKGEQALMAQLSGPKWFLIFMIKLTLIFICQVAYGISQLARKRLSLKNIQKRKRDGMLLTKKPLKLKAF